MANQGKVIDSLNRFLNKQKHIKLQLNNDGICSGLTVLYLLAKAKKQENSFFASIDNIADLRKANYEQNASEASKFCGIAEIAYAPFRYKRNVTQSDVSKIAEMIGEKLPIYKKFSTSVVCNTNARLEWLLKNTVFDDDLIYLGSSSHAIGLYKKNDLYYLYDPNYEDGEKSFRSIKDLAAEIKKRLPSSNDQEFALNINIFSNPYRPVVKNIFPSKNEIAKQLYEQSNQQNVKDQALHHCCFNGDSEMAEELLSLGANPSAQDKAGVTPLGVAYTHGHLNTARILQKDSRWKISDSDIITALVFATAKGQVHSYNELMKNRIDYPPLKNFLKQYFNANTLLHLACESGNEELVETILKKDPGDMFVQNAEHETPLMRAAIKGHIKVVKSLLKQSEIYIDTNSLQKSLHLAMKNGHDKIVNILSKIDGISLSEASPIAIKYGYEDLVKKCLEQNIAIGNNSLKIALENHQPAIFLQIFKHRTKNIQNLISGTEALIYAIMQRELEFLPALLNRIDFNTVSKYELKPLDFLTFLCSKGDAQVLQQLLSNKKVLALAAANGAQLLTAAGKEGHTEVVKLLRKNYISSFKSSDTTIYMDHFLKACTSGDFDAVEAFMHAGANAQWVDTTGQTALEIAIENCHPQIAMTLLNSLGPNKLDKKLAKKILKISIQQGYREVIEWLIKNKIPVNKTFEIKTGNQTQKLTPIEIACKYPDEAVLECLINLGANITTVKEKLLLFTAKYGYSNLLKSLPSHLDYNSLISVTNKQQRHILDIAVHFDQWEILSSLIEKGANIANAAEQGYRLLYNACERGLYSKAQIICHYQPELQLSDDDFCKLFSSACDNKQIEVLRALIVTGKDIHQGIVNQQIMSSLATAVEKDHYEIIKHFCNLKFDLNQTIDGQTLFEIACNNQKPHIANHLLLYNVAIPDTDDLIMHLKNAYNLNSNNCNSLELLLDDLKEHAYKKGHIAIYQLLCNKKHYSQQKDVNHHLKILGKNDNTKTKLNLNYSIEHFLLNTKPQKTITQLPSRSEELLDFASANDQSQIVLDLLANGANPLQANNSGLILLFKSCIDGQQKIVEELIAKGVDFDHSHDNNQAIDIAAVYGHKNIVKLLVDAYEKRGLDINTLLNRAINNQQWQLSASLLELIPANKIYQKQIKSLQKFRYAIRDSYLEILKGPENSLQHRHDALNRLTETVNNQNALGRLLHTPVHPFFFRFTLVKDVFGGKITKSIDLLTKRISTLEQEKLRILNSNVTYT